MSERIAVVGSRELPPLEKLEEWLTWLRGTHPDSLVVSGGAKGVDSFAEKWWAKYGAVESYRPARRKDSFGVALWSYGAAVPQPSTRFMLEMPTFEDYRSALFFRNMLIAERCDRLVAFYRRGGSRGTRFTVDCARGEGKDVYEVYGD